MSNIQENRFDVVIELIQLLQHESAQYFNKLESLSSCSCSEIDLKDELKRLQQHTKQLSNKLEASGLSALPGGEMDFGEMEPQAFIKKAREDTDNNRLTLHRIQSNCKTLIQALSKNK